VPHADDEYRVLRQTIALRGTVRIALLPATLAGWSLLAAGLLNFGEVPYAAVFPLGLLAGGFEAIHALHVGVERIGRYLQVFYETAPNGPRWETTAMAVGPALPGGGTDPLFSVVFVLAAAANLMTAWVVEPTPLEVGVLVSLHLAFVVRVVRARIAASRQRAVELESYRAILAGEPKG
jgi:hypothetical protein